MALIEMTMNKITFTNRSTKTKRLIIEPWAEEYLIDPDVSVEIIATGKSTASVEIDYADRGIVVHGWTDGSLTVMLDGIELEQSPQT